MVLSLPVPPTTSRLVLQETMRAESGTNVSRRIQPAIVEGIVSRNANDNYAYFWLWDVRDLLMAKEGSMNPCDVRPYDYGEFILPFNNTDIGGATYDSDSGLLYIQYRGLIGSKRPIRIPPLWRPTGSLRQRRAKIRSRPCL